MATSQEVKLKKKRRYSAEEKNNPACVPAVCRQDDDASYILIKDQVLQLILLHDEDILHSDSQRGFFLRWYWSVDCLSHLLYPWLGHRLF